MNKRATFLKNQITKSAISKSKEIGEIISINDLKHLKIQIVSLPIRLFSGLLALGCLWGGYEAFSFSSLPLCVFNWFLCLMFTYVSLMGIKKTVEEAFPMIELAEDSDILGMILEGVISGIEGILDL